MVGAVFGGECLMMRDTIDMARLNRRVQTLSLPAAPGCHWVRASSVGQLEMFSWAHIGEVFDLSCGLRLLLLSFFLFDAVSFCLGRFSPSWFGVCEGVLCDVA